MDQSFVWISILFSIVMFVVGIAAFVFWVYTLIHAIKHDNKDKALWIVLIVFTGVVGSLIYYFVVMRATTSTPTGMSGHHMPPTSMPPSA
ncbi:PLDc N-terminal domain-containing protein [Candidatus Uhrbacteria bacterium]|nr:PLDc N-terminal domain-containing protein [Candidatus Uhrbacteria bacterium]